MRNTERIGLNPAPTGEKVAVTYERSDQPVRVEKPNGIAMVTKSEITFSDGRTYSRVVHGNNHTESNILV